MGEGYRPSAPWLRLCFRGQRTHCGGQLLTLLCIS